jgi:hypothetical protein
VVGVQTLIFITRVNNNNNNNNNNIFIIIIIIIASQWMSFVHTAKKGTQMM